MTMRKELILQPKNPVAEFTDQYGEKQVIHRKKGRRLSVFRNNETPVLVINRAVSILIGQKIKAKRLSLKMTLRDLCIRTGISNVNPKEYMWSIESATRMNGCRMGTLFAIARALNCEVSELLPTTKEALEYAEIKEKVTTLI